MQEFNINQIRDMLEKPFNNQISIKKDEDKFIEDSIRIYIFDLAVDNFIKYYRLHSLNPCSKSFQKGFIIGLIYKINLKGYNFPRSHIKSMNKQIARYYIVLRDLYDSQLVTQCLDQNFELFNIIEILSEIDTVNENLIIVNKDILLLGVFLSILIKI